MKDRRVDQAAGKAINVQQLTLAYEELQRLIVGTDADRPGYDLALLDDEELDLFTKLASKASGEDVGEILLPKTQAFQIEFVDTQPALPAPQPAAVPTPLMPFIGKLPASELPPAPVMLEPEPEKPGIVGRVVNAVVDAITPAPAQKASDSKYSEIKARRRSIWSGKRDEARVELEALEEEWRTLEAARLSGSGCDYLRLQQLPTMIHAARQRISGVKRQPVLTVAPRDDYAAAFGAKPTPAGPTVIEQILAAFTKTNDSLSAPKPFHKRRDPFEVAMLDPDDYRAIGDAMRGHYGHDDAPSSPMSGDNPGKAVLEQMRRRQ